METNVNFFLLEIAYKGTDYFGWQKQPDQKTIQGEIEKVLKKICQINQFKTLGSSRTDRGVHALKQYCKLEIELSIDEKGLLKVFKDNLPKDIKVLSITPVYQDFHPIFHVERKTYCYLFTFGTHEPSPFFNDLIYHHPYELDLDLMERATSLLVGEFDFRNFQCKGTEVASTIRRIFSASLTPLNPANNTFSYAVTGVHCFCFEGNGFLKQMVRMLVGGLFSVGQGKVGLEAFSDFLSLKKEGRAGKLAGAEGLYLTDIILKGDEKF